MIRPITRLFLLLVLSGATFLGAAEIIAPDYVTVGEGFTIFIRSDSDAPLSGGEVTLSLGGGKVLSRSRFFRLPLEEGRSEKIWCSVMGVPSDLKEGSYTLDCRMESDEVVEHFQQAIGVSSRDFETEDLHLTKGLTDLRTQENPEKVAQAQKLWSILASFNERAVYQTEELVSPLDEGFRTTTSFGERRIYIYDDGSEANSIHNGWDWAAPTGSPVYAVGKGQVVLAEKRIVTGNTVILELLPGVYLLYYHLDELTVEEGEFVDPGQQVGTLGSTGLSTGPHLHWELRVSKVAVDPLPFFEDSLIDKTLYLTKMMDTL